MRKLIVIAVCLMFAAASANAAPALQTMTFTDQYTGFFNMDQQLEVPQFNPLWGDLLGVTVTFSLSADGTLGYENTNATNGGTRTVRTFFSYGGETYATEGELSLMLNGAALASVDWYVTETYTFYVAPYDGVTDYAGESGWTVVYLAESTGGFASFGDDLGAFIGSGFLDLSLVGDAMAAISFPSGATSMRTTGTTDVLVSYQYVPEPATMGLLAMGLVGLIARRRRK